MAKTTIKSLTDSQIRGLRTEAVEAGDFLMGAICDLALDGEIDTDSYTTLSVEDARRVRGMGRDEAYAAIVEAINAAEDA
jgi:hypothetical protein